MNFQIFLSPAHEVGAGDIVITMSGRASVFRSQTISLKPLAGLLSYCIHTSLRGCRCAFCELWPLTLFLTFDFEAIIDFNWLLMSSSVSGRYPAKRLLNCFHTAHTNPSGGVDVPFGGYDLWPNFFPLILRRLLTLFDFGWSVQFPDDISRSVYCIVFILHTHITQGSRCAFLGLWPLT